MSFFDALGPGKESRPHPEFEVVEGRFTCQERDCWESVNEAKYSADAHFLTWKCPVGHISKIEDFDF